MDLLFNDVVKGFLKERRRFRLFYLRWYKVERIVYGRVEEE